jgi:NAD(P)-dependent dehydrogenase (short-subunit alcohol dehydrogenase family)
MPQRVLVTAGASGIGREIVRAFAAKGASVFIDAKALNALASEISSLKIGVCDMSNVRTSSLGGRMHAGVGWP